MQRLVGMYWCEHARGRECDRGVTHVLCIGDFPHEGGVDDTVVLISIVVEDDLGLALERDAVVGYPLDLDRRRLVLSLLGIPSARRLAP